MPNAVTTNGAFASNGLPGGSLAANTAHTFNYTCPANTDCLVIAECSVGGGGIVPGPPTAFTYNGVALTMVPGSSGGYAVGSQSGSIWYILAGQLTTGSSLVVSVTYANQLFEGEWLIIPLINVNQVAPVGTAALFNNGATAAPAVTATGGGSNDLYIARLQYNNSGAVTDTGTNQTQLGKLTDLVSYTGVLSSIGGSNAGAFSWSITSGRCDACAVVFLAVPPFGLVVQSNSFNDTSITIPHQVSFTANVRQGSTLFLAVNSFGQSIASVLDTLNGSWSPAADVGADGVGPSTSIWSFLSTLGGACTVKITLSGAGPAAMWAGEVAGIAAANALDVTGALSTGTSSSTITVSTSKLTAYNQEFLLCAAGYPGTSTPTPNFGLTLDPNGNVGKLAVGYVVTTQSGGATAGFSVSPAVSNNACVVAVYVPPLAIARPPMQAGGMIQSMMQ